MVINDPAALINAVVCAVIVVVLMFYQRGDSRHRPAISLLAYIIVLVYATPGELWRRRIIQHG